MKVINGYTKKEEIVRPMTLDEVKALNYGHIWFIANDGLLRQAKVNGKVRRWKRNPDRFELPLKYGLYEYATFTSVDLPRLVVPV